MYTVQLNSDVEDSSDDGTDKEDDNIENQAHKRDRGQLPTLTAGAGIFRGQRDESGGD